MEIVDNEMKINKIKHLILRNIKCCISTCAGAETEKAAVREAELAKFGTLLVENSIDELLPFDSGGMLRNRLNFLFSATK
jgi:hypothetical protein